MTKKSFRYWRGLGVALCVAVCFACEGSDYYSGGGGAGDPWATDGGSGSGGGGWTEAGAPIDPSQRDARTCGGQNVPIQVKKGAVPDLFLVVDKSGSMQTPVDFFKWHLGTKWDAMKKALSGLVDRYKTNIRFGLSTYPSDSACGAGRTDVALALNANGAIKARLNAIRPTGSTPTHTTLAAAARYFSSTAKGAGGRYVLLATDGMPNCGTSNGSGDTGAQTLAAVQSLARSGIRTFVIGFGALFSANPRLLNQLAVAGGVANTGANKFYAATNQADLQKTFLKIAGGIVPPPCTFRLTKRPPDPSKVQVKFDGTPVPRSLSNKSGWNYTDKGASITLFGAMCTKLQSGTVKQVKVVYGCKGPIIN